jgi:hypothetical protein
MERSRFRGRSRGHGWDDWRGRHPGEAAYNRRPGGSSAPANGTGGGGGGGAGAFLIDVGTVTSTATVTGGNGGTAGNTTGSLASDGGGGGGAGLMLLSINATSTLTLKCVNDLCEASGAFRAESTFPGGDPKLRLRQSASKGEGKNSIIVLFLSGG